MRDALAAEMLKLTRLRATWLLVWIYPILLALLAAIMLSYGLLSGRPSGSVVNAAQWTQQSALFWSFPQTTFGRYLIASFAVFCTASEYGWNTWKLIIPARSRWQLIAAKMAVAAGLLFASFLAADLIYLASAALNALLVGPSLPAGLSVADLIAAHGRGMIWALPPTLYTIVLATCLSVLTRSSLGALLSAVGLITLESMLPMAAMLASGYAPGITRALVEILPFYHVANLRSWCGEGHALLLILTPQTTLAAGLAHSLAILTGWTAALAAAAIIHFDRQDLN